MYNPRVHTDSLCVARNILFLSDLSDDDAVYTMLMDE